MLDRSRERRYGTWDKEEQITKKILELEAEIKSLEKYEN
jgi:hypothetical protein